jgi:hypothetical protein
MKTLFLNCVLFTLKGQEVRENKYLPIFYVWLSKLVQNGGLTKDDFLLISIDERTLEFIKTTAKCLAYLLSQLKCPYAFKIFPSPVTLLDGMRIRYTPHDFKQDVYLYLDIDILIMKSLRLIVDQTAPAKLYVCTEGTLRDPNYGADMSSTDDPGYTSGIFIISSNSLQKMLFLKINDNYLDKGYYAQDQPFFNRAVYEMENDIDNTLITRYTSFNGWGYSPDLTVLLNCGGDVGDGEKHYDKIQEVQCLINAGYFS